MSFKPDLRALQDCIQFRPPSREVTSTTPLKSDSRRENILRLSSEYQRNHGVNIFKSPAVKPNTTKGYQSSLRSREGSLQRTKQKFDFISEGDSLVLKTNREICHSQRSDFTEPEDKPKEIPQRFNEKEEGHKRWNTRNLHKPTPVYVNAQMNTSSGLEKVTSRDGVNEKMQHNYNHFKKATGKLWLKFFDKMEDKEKGSNLLGKSEEPKPSILNEDEKSLRGDTSPLRLFGYRRQSLSNKQSGLTFTSPKNTPNALPYKTVVLPIDSINEQKKSVVESKQVIKRIYTNKRHFPKDQEDGDKNNNDSPKKGIKGGLKDSEYHRLRSIRNYIIQKKNLQFYDPYPREFLSYRAIASIIAQGNTHCVINQNMFSSAQMHASPKTTLQPSVSNKFFGRGFEGDIVSKSLVLAPPEKRRPVLVTSRPGTSPDKGFKSARGGYRSESPNKGRTRSLIKDSDIKKLKLKLQKEADNFEVAGWGQHTDGSPMACNN